MAKTTREIMEGIVGEADFNDESYECDDMELTEATDEEDSDTFGKGGSHGGRAERRAKTRKHKKKVKERAQSAEQSLRKRAADAENAKETSSSSAAAVKLSRGEKLCSRAGKLKTAVEQDKQKREDCIKEAEVWKARADEKEQSISKALERGASEKEVENMREEYLKLISKSIQALERAKKYSA